MFFYSASTSGFYTTEVHGTGIPADAVEVSIEEHEALMQGQSEGKDICAGADGRPALVDPPPPPALEPVPLPERLTALGIPLADLKAALEAL
jgi:hypothetical protein